MFDVRELMSDYQSYLATLRRVPADVVRAVATREFRMSQGETCLVGWVVREQLARLADCTPESINPYGMIVTKDGWKIGDTWKTWSPAEKAPELFGGAPEDWERIYGNVEDADELPLIELAFVRRVRECVR